MSGLSYLCVSACLSLFLYLVCPFQHLWRRVHKHLCGFVGFYIYVFSKENLWPRVQVPGSQDPQVHRSVMYSSMCVRVSILEPLHVSACVSISKFQSL